MKKLLTISLCLALTIITEIQAQEMPDFSGAWVLDTSRGENLGMVAAIQQTVIISQAADKLTLDITTIFQGKESVRQVIYDLTGGPTTNETAMGEKSETLASWVDGKLVTLWTSEGAIAGSKVVRTEIRSLSEEGDTMLVSTARGGRPAMIRVFDKQQ